MNSSTELLELYACELGSGPKYGNTIQWSDEGLLAVATGPIITIVDPNKPFRRHQVIPPACRKEPGEGGAAQQWPHSLDSVQMCDKDDGQDSVKSSGQRLTVKNHLLLSSYASQAIGKANTRRATYKCFAWAPLGSSALDGGCVLATVADGRVCLWAKPNGHFVTTSSEWRCISRVSEDLLMAHLQRAASKRSSFPTVQRPQKRQALFGHVPWKGRPIRQPAGVGEEATGTKQAEPEHAVNENCTNHATVPKAVDEAHEQGPPGAIATLSALREGEGGAGRTSRWALGVGVDVEVLQIHDGHCGCRYQGQIVEALKLERPSLPLEKAEKVSEMSEATHVRVQYSHLRLSTQGEAPRPAASQEGDIVPVKVQVFHHNSHLALVQEYVRGKHAKGRRPLPRGELIRPKYDSARETQLAQATSTKSQMSPSWAVPGTYVDVFHENGWWEAQISNVIQSEGSQDGSRMYEVLLIAEEKALVVGIDHLRLALHFDGCRWYSLSPTLVCSASLVTPKMRKAVRNEHLGKSKHDRENKSLESVYQETKACLDRHLGELEATVNGLMRSYPQGKASKAKEETGGPAGTKGVRQQRQRSLLTAIADTACVACFASARGQLPVQLQESYAKSSEHLRGSDLILLSSITDHVMNTFGDSLAKNSVQEQPLRLAIRIAIRDHLKPKASIVRKMQKRRDREQLKEQQNQVREAQRLEREKAKQESRRKGMGPGEEREAATEGASQPRKRPRSSRESEVSEKDMSKKPPGRAKQSKRSGFLEPEECLYRSAQLRAQAVAWSPLLRSKDGQVSCLLAVGSESGDITLWKLVVEEKYDLRQASAGNQADWLPKFSLLGTLSVSCSFAWVTAIDWAIVGGGHLVHLAAGCSDGSAYIFTISARDLLAHDADEDLNNLFSGKTARVTMCDADDCAISCVSVAHMSVPGNPSQVGPLIAVLAKGRRVVCLGLWYVEQSRKKLVDSPDMKHLRAECGWTHTFTVPGVRISGLKVSALPDFTTSEKADTVQAEITVSSQTEGIFRSSARFSAANRCVVGGQQAPVQVTQSSKYVHTMGIALSANGLIIASITSPAVRISANANSHLHPRSDADDIRNCNAQVIVHAVCPKFEVTSMSQPHSGSQQPVHLFADWQDWCMLIVDDMMKRGSLCKSFDGVRPLIPQASLTALTHVLRQAKMLEGRSASEDDRSVPLRALLSTIERLEEPVPSPPFGSDGSQDERKSRLLVLLMRLATSFLEKDGASRKKISAALAVKEGAIMTALMEIDSGHSTTDCRDVPSVEIYGEPLCCAQTSDPILGRSWTCQVCDRRMLRSPLCPLCGIVGSLFQVEGIC